MKLFVGCIVSMVAGVCIFLFYPHHDYFRALSIPLFFGSYFILILGALNRTTNVQLHRHVRGRR